jgi:hypothetical protein
MTTYSVAYLLVLGALSVLLGACLAVWYRDGQEGNIARALYGRAVAWVAEHDSAPLDRDGRPIVLDMVDRPTVRLLCDLFGRDLDDVVFDVTVLVRQRRSL